MPGDAESDIERWIDTNELTALVSELASAVDRADHDRIVSCYTEDSFDDHGVFKGTGRAFADFICHSGLFTFMHHVIGQSVFDLYPDQREAWGETYFTFRGGVGSSVVLGCGRYVDYFVKTDGGWKVQYRRVVPDEIPAGDDLNSYWKATRDRHDPSYDRRKDPGETWPDTDASV
jgi:SnoaL-like domain